MSRVNSRDVSGIVSTTYVGPKDNLQGKAALVRDGAAADRVLAQFDDLKTGYGIGWHEFPRSDFRMWSPKV